jgi:hypothetical protein
MAGFYTETGIIGQFLSGMNDITGSLFITLMVITIILVLICLALRMPMEASAMVLLPFFFTIASMTGEFKAVMGATLIYLGFIIGKNLIPHN